MMLAQAAPSAARAEWHLFGDYYLADARFLILVPLVLLALWWGRGVAGRARARAVLPVGPAWPRSARQRLAALPAALAAAALVSVCVALARPVRANVIERTVSEGVDIALVIDRSGSMRFPDMEQGKSRIDVVKDVVDDFIERRTGDRVGAADSIALVTFARYPRLLCPFTLDAGALEEFLDDVDYTRVEAEDGTAIGSALAKAVALLRETDAKSKVVVLLTDGRNNVDDIPPAEAARLAAEEGIRVHTILAGRYQYEFDLFRNAWVPTEAELDPSELKQMAETTGGRFWRARDRAGLEEVYADIEALEKTKRTEEHDTQTHDLYPWFLLPGLLLYTLAWLSGSTWLGRLP